MKNNQSLIKELSHVRQKLTAAIKSDPLSTIFFAMEGLNEMVVITDLEHEIVYVNAACRGVLGYDPEELMGRKATEYFEEIPGNPTDLAGKIAREARMADLKKVIRKLRKQIEDNGQVPVADDPLINGTE